MKERQSGINGLKKIKIKNKKEGKVSLKILLNTTPWISKVKVIEFQEERINALEGRRIIDVAAE